jgi:hypothetical protein
MAGALLEAHTRPVRRIKLNNGRSSMQIAMAGQVVSSILGLVHALAAAGVGIPELPALMWAREMAEGTLIYSHSPAVATIALGRCTIWYLIVSFYRARPVPLSTRSSTNARRF